MTMRRLLLHSAPWVSVVGLLVCVGLLFVLVPHAHADGSADQLSKPCSVCVSKQSVSGIVHCAPVILDVPTFESIRIHLSESPHISVGDLLVWAERAPPVA